MLLFEKDRNRWYPLAAAGSCFDDALLTVLPMPGMFETGSKNQERHQVSYHDLQFFLRYLPSCDFDCIWEAFAEVSIGFVQRMLCCWMPVVFIAHRMGMWVRPLKSSRYFSVEDGTGFCADKQSDEVPKCDDIEHSLSIAEDSVHRCLSSDKNSCPLCMDQNGGWCIFGRSIVRIVDFGGNLVIRYSAACG